MSHCALRQSKKPRMAAIPTNHGHVRTEGVEAGSMGFASGIGGAAEVLLNEMAGIATAEGRTLAGEMTFEDVVLGMELLGTRGFRILELGGCTLEYSSAVK